MKFYDFLDCMNVELDLKRYPNQNGRWIAQINDAETKDGCILSGEYGNAKNPKDAINDYIRNIVGKTIVVCSTIETMRREFVCPMSIEFINEEELKWRGSK